MPKSSPTVGHWDGNNSGEAERQCCETPNHLETVERQTRFENVRRPCVFGVCGSGFQAFSCSSSGTQWHTCFFSESGKSCNHGFNSWDLEEGKKQTSVLARLRNEAAPSAPLPDSGRGGGESPLPSLVQTSNLSCSDLIYCLLISIQPRRRSLGQHRREVSQSRSRSWSCRALAGVCVSFPCYAPRGQECIRPVQALPAPH